MALRLLVGDVGAEGRSELRKTFADIAAVTVIDADLRSLAATPGLDCILLVGTLAHEWYGGKPAQGRTQILSTSSFYGYPGERIEPMPRWVATAALPHGENYSEEEACTVNFEEIFEAIEQFNAEHPDDVIQLLGINARFLYLDHFVTLDQLKAQGVARAIHTAYVRHYLPNPSIQSESAT